MGLDTIEISATAAQKADRYLTSSQLKRVLREETGYVCRKSSPNHDDLHPDDEFIIRGAFCGESLDIVFTVEDDRVVVVTQMSQHSESLRGDFEANASGLDPEAVHEVVGESASDAVDCGK